MKLTIKGHPERGNKVIKILEMLGGYNANNHYGNHCDKVYYINENGYIDWDFIFRIEQHAEFIIFSLEEFLEKFPYKVGDKVNYVKYNDDYPSVYTIQRMWWTGVTIEYLLDSSGFSALTKDLQPYIEEKDEKSANHVFDTEIISFDIAQRDKYELDLQGKFKVVLREGKYYVERIKPQYPKTYEECCKVLFPNTIELGKVSAHGYNGKLLEKFGELLICRDAYWKIAGEEMGLGKYWEPDWEDENEIYYTISYDGINIKCYNGTDVYSKLAFPTEEMRDAFYENFKDLIEQCKELL